MSSRNMHDEVLHCISSLGLLHLLTTPVLIEYDGGASFFKCSEVHVIYAYNLDCFVVFNLHVIF